MPTKQTTLRKIGAFPGNGAKGPYVRSVFVDDDNIEWTTFNDGIASQADALVGQTVELVGEEEQRGQYTNRKLVAVSAVANGSTPVASPEAPAQITHSHDSKQTYIHRQSSLKAAIECFIGAQLDPLESLDEVLELSDRFVEYVENGRNA